PGRAGRRERDPADARLPVGVRGVPVRQGCRDPQRGVRRAFRALPGVSVVAAPGAGVKARLRTVIGLLLVAGYLFPIYWMVTASVKTQADIRAVPPQLVPTHPELTTWRERIFSDPRVLHYVTNSFIVATGTMVLTVLLAAPAAYALARY